MQKQINKDNINKSKLMRIILIAFLSIAIALSVYNIFFIYPSFTKLVIDTTKNDSVRAARYLASVLIPEGAELRKDFFNNDALIEIEKIINAYELNKLKVFSRSGETIFSTDSEDIGKINQKKYFHEIVANGNIHSEVVQKGTKSLEGQKVTADVVETYVPRMIGDTFLGAFEIYYDITTRTKQFDSLLTLSSAVLFTLVLGLFLSILIIWFKENKTIAERMQVEKALQESEEKLSGILNSVQDIIIVVDKELNIIWSNPVAVEFFGSDPAGRKCYDIFKFRYNPCASCCVKKCFQDGQSDEHEIEIIGKDGDRMDLRCSASVASWSEDGAPKSVIIIYRDITEKKMLQAETARSGQLALIGELAAGVAHEINSPINGIINCAQLLIDVGSEQGEQTEISERIMKAGGRIAMIVRNLLSFAHDHEDEPALVHLRSVLSDSLDLTETQIRKDGIDLNITIPDKPTRIKVRSHKIQQVFLNIISNARYALNQKFPHSHADKILQIDGEVAVSNNIEYIRVTFFDRGTGIPGEIIDRICDPFFTTKPPGKGTGLGLSISHAIIKDHGGRLYFDSVEGEYTRIIIDLPVFGGENGKEDENSDR
jgi:PAS domain S-box-containing protein